jgi:hypothetical protein
MIPGILTLQCRRKAFSLKRFLGLALNNSEPSHTVLNRFSLVLRAGIFSFLP